MDIERLEDRAANREHARAYRQRLRDKAKACPELRELLRQKWRERKRLQREKSTPRKPDVTGDFFA